MADSVVLGTSGNDVIDSSTAGTGAGSLVLTVAGTIAQGVRPLFDVLVNGTVVRTGILVTADNHDLNTQQVYVPLPAGTINSVTIDYTNDPQTDYSTQDRNLYIKSATLNGTALPVASASYTRDGFTGPDNAEDGHVIQGREDMNWGGEMTWTGSLVSNATAPSGGDKLIDAGAGIDTVTFSGARADYTLSHAGTGFSITPVGGGQKIDFGSVERLSFGDGTKLAIDMNGDAGTTAKMMEVLLGHSFLSNKALVGQVMDLLDHGYDPTQLLQLGIQSDAYTQLVGGTSNADFVRYVYHNVAGFDPSQSDLNSLVGLLDSGATTKAGMALAAANLDIVEAHLVGVMDNGIEYS